MYLGNCHYSNCYHKHLEVAMNYCLNCGRQISKKQKTCSHECSLVIRKKKSENKKPPEFLVCQNPKCGKKLDHWMTYSGKKSYQPGKKYCSRECCSIHKSIVQTGKPTGRKGIPIPKKEVCVTMSMPENFTDPFSLSEEI